MTAAQNEREDDGKASARTTGGYLTHQSALDMPALRSLMGDRLISPDDRQYDAFRRVWNGMHDRHPVLIARCRDTADVAAVIRFARAAGHSVTVRGGGHNVAGSAVADHAVMIDLSLMTAVTVDPASRTATAAGGCLLRDVDAATIPHGLACPAGVVSHTGLAGLALGGGYGWLARKWGLTCDHILRAEVVLADGSIVEADDVTHPDLLWALRGGGGNFGIVTRFTLRLRRVGPVAYRSGVHAMDTASAALEAYREFAERQPPDLHTVGALKIAGTQDWLPRELHGKPALFLTAIWLGDSARAGEMIAPLFAASSPSAVLNQVLTHAELQALGDYGEPHGNRYFTKSCYLSELTSASVHEAIEAAAEITSPLSCIDFEFLRGAILDVPEQTSAFPARQAPYIFTASAQWTDSRTDEEHVDWARRSMARLAPWSSGGAYVNYLQDEVGINVAEHYGRDRYRKLSEVKSRYDPDNIFHHNHNIAPA
ncbi:MULTISPECIES: FAD-binding oxidoreductase [Nocardia]|uniref:FAD-binding oxidoreductase n=1 Tax=Nocardia TaxID=1817 RepID=UPI001916758C|nr:MULTISPECIES: FAD-binding oxidoreductase [Nocardia]